MSSSDGDLARRSTWPSRALSAALMAATPMAAAPLAGCGDDELVRPAPSEGAGGVGGGPACADFADESGTDPTAVNGAVELHVENGTGADLFFRVDCERLTDRAILRNGESAPFDIGPCDVSCEQLQRPAVACGSCPTYIFHLPAGATFTDVWSGLVEVPTTMPAACFDDGWGGPSGSGDSGASSGSGASASEWPCDRREVAPQGLYEVALEAFEACDCECDGNRCEGRVLGSPILASSEFLFPRGERVGIEF